jgi:crotonobetainyl-CoA:carnitine CoA-transferase CaiB-like acyl-CoA transferase
MDCDLALFDVAVSMLTYPATWYLNAGELPQRTSHSAHPSLVPFQNFETADGWIVVACAKEKFWQRLCEVIDRPDLREDPRFRTFAGRRRHAAELLPTLEASFRQRPTAAWVRAIGAAGVPCGPIAGVPEALADRQTEARGLVVDTDHPRFGRLRTPATAIRVGTPRERHRRAPQRSEDADAILGEVLRYDRRRIRELATAGAFGAV